MKKSIKVERTAHYHLMGVEKPRILLYVIHGYGQLAEDFLNDFDELEQSELCIVAPEALSKFYSKKGEAVANWMTSHEREDEIEDYVNYLEKLHSHLLAEYAPEKVLVLGYSQGVSTTLRWVAHCGRKFEKIYLCSGSIPPELQEEDLQHQAQADFHYFYGDNDPLLSMHNAQQYIKQLKELMKNTVAHPFKGGHEIAKTCIDQIRADIRSMKD